MSAGAGGGRIVGSEWARLVRPVIGVAAVDAIVDDVHVDRVMDEVLAAQRGSDGLSGTCAVLR